MRQALLVRRSLVHYWRTNLAVIAGVATAVSVLAGALIVGDSVRASLRELALQRLGKTDDVLLSNSFFRDQLARDLQSDARFASTFDKTAPLIVLEGFVIAQPGGRRASHVQVYGVDARFWQFHGQDRMTAPAGNEALLSEGLASELGTSAGATVLLRVESGSAIPIETLHGRKEDVGRTVRLTVRQVLAPGDLGEFSLSQQQGSVRAVFVALPRIQLLLGQRDRVNALVVAERPAAASTVERPRDVVESAVRATASLDDLNLRIRALDEAKSLALENRSTFLSDSQASAGRRAAGRIGMSAQPVLTYLANSIRSGDRSIPYSVVTAVDLESFSRAFAASPADRALRPEDRPIVLNAWAAKDLGVQPGDPVSLDYYVWEEEGRLATRSADFHVAGIVPIEGAAADRNLVPDYPGITDTESLSQWDPPFPVDLKRVRPIDEAYWKQYRTTPKAFVSLEAGQQLWRSRYGAITQLRIPIPEGRALAEAEEQYGRMLRAEIDPMTEGLSVLDVRTQSLAASGGATDFGEYFTYFSFFLVVSALLLAALFFKLGIEQRLREIGLLQALGLSPGAVRALFLGEGLVLSLLGGLAGMAGAVGYAAAIMFGLRTWWVGAVGTTALTLHASPDSLVAGAVSGVLVAAACIWWTLRSLNRVSTRRLLAGGPLGVTLPESDTRRARGLSPLRMFQLAGGILALLAAALLVAAATERVGRVAGFFGAGTLSLVATLCWAAAWLRRGRAGTLHGHGLPAVARLGLRNATSHPARSVLCIALIASATFVIVAVEAFKRDDATATVDRHSGTGGYGLLVDTLLPIVHDLNDSAGRDSLGLPQSADLQDVRFDRFRVRPGDDASCLNLYQPRNPRILSASPEFVASGRFRFQDSIAETDSERGNPWLLLNREFPDQAIPVISDANSMMYVLHLKLGDDIVLPGTSDRPVRLRLVASLADSIFQGELVMSESHFVRAFPDREGYRFFLLDLPPSRITAVTELLETRLTDFGADASSTAERLARFHRVEYTYLSTFQMLGGLGLLLGTLGLGAVLLRNVFERRRELALLRALGYRQRDFFAMVIAENALLLLCGLAAGAVCALVAISPMFLDRGGRLPAAAIGLLLLGVLATGLMASLGATVAALRSPLLPALRSE